MNPPASSARRGQHYQARCDHRGRVHSLPDTDEPALHRGLIDRRRRYAVVLSGEGALQQEGIGKGIYLRNPWRYFPIGTAIIGCRGRVCAAGGGEGGGQDADRRLVSVSFVYFPPHRAQELSNTCF